MLRRRIAGTVCSLTVAMLGLAVAPGVAGATAPAAQSPAPSSASPTDSGGYPAQSPLLTVSSGSVSVGGSVTVTGHGFQGGEGVDISVTYAPASHALGSGGPVAQSAAFTPRHSVGRTASAAHMVAASDGTFSTQVSLTQAGNATITATGEQSHLTVAATVSVAPATIVASTKSTKHALPSPNIEVLIGVLAIVVLLVAAGIAWPRRWRKPSPAYDVSTT
jgi:hypothetical protein